jgi:hypothetical protein
LHQLGQRLRVLVQVAQRKGPEHQGYSPRALARELLQVRVRTPSVRAIIVSVFYDHDSRIEPPEHAVGVGRRH